ncbi:MAG: site-specific integrase [Acidobacteriota bacterium]|nr:site-specific integrase [Acidobacteriota bacterium]
MTRRKKTDSDWRKQKRQHGGSIRVRDGKVFARIQFIGEDGRKRDKERPAKNRKHARDLIKEMRQELSQGGEGALEAHSMTLARLAASYEKGKLIPAVIQDGKKVAGLRSYASTKRFLVPLLAQFGRRHIRSIKHSDIEAYKMTRLQAPVRCGTDVKGKPIFRPRSITCVNRELALLRAMFTHAEHNDWVAKSPFKRGAALIAMTAERQRDRILSREEEWRLLEACTGRRAHLKPLILTAVDTGMRKGELFKLQWTDIDFVANLIVVRATNTKTERRREIGMTPRVRSALNELRTQAPPNYSGAVFGRGLKQKRDAWLPIRDTIKTGWGSALRKAKIEDLHFHDLRHTFCTRSIRSGLPASEVMVLSGHTQYSTFRRYVNPGREAARAGANLLAAYLDQSAPVEQSETVN